ncbi:MAG: MBL fold metallo-hydrolase [Magnetococcales bacterium]|nr:MBL fold metallo-hydrolase [Magnetococcales bacterium]
MKIRFWGVRGSIPSPGAKTVRYGGNTSCIELRSDAGDLVILDAGTGIFPLSQTLLSEMPITAHIFITHTHWDHIQGLPFFIPTFVPGNRIRIHGAFDPISQNDLRNVLTRQMEYCYFPVREAELKATMEYHTLRERQTVHCGDATVTNLFMNHPVLNFGYKIECGGKSVFFTGDHEPLFNIYDPEDDDYDEYASFMDQKNQSIIDFITGCDLLIADTSYTRDEYPAKRGWGHGTYDTSIAMARAAGVKQLVFTHHEPTRSDEHLERIYQETMARYPHQPGDPVCLLAQEGLEIQL